MLKPYTNGISTLTVSDQLCVFRPGPEERKIKHCHTYHPCLGTSHASLTYYFLSHCADRILAVYSRGSRNCCLSRRGHPTSPIRKFRIRSTRKGGPVSNKPNLRRTQTGFKMSAGDCNLTTVVNVQPQLDTIKQIG